MCPTQTTLPTSSGPPTTPSPATTTTEPGGRFACRDPRRRRRRHRRRRRRRHRRRRRSAAGRAPRSRLSMRGRTKIRMATSPTAPAMDVLATMTSFAMSTTSKTKQLRRQSGRQTTLPLPIATSRTLARRRCGNAISPTTTAPTTRRAGSFSDSRRQQRCAPSGFRPTEGMGPYTVRASPVMERSVARTCTAAVVT